MSRSYIYDAFISYRHTTLDKAVAERLQRLLEGYVPPKSMDNSRKFEKWRIFRDETELPTSSDLGGDIKTALENSKYLIVVCSNTKGIRDGVWRRLIILNPCTEEARKI